MIYFIEIYQRSNSDNTCDNMIYLSKALESWLN